MDETNSYPEHGAPLTVLLAVLKEAQDSVRGFDTKAQIVGIGFIFSLGVVGGIRESFLGGAEVTQTPWLVAITYLTAIVPIAMFGAVLYPSRRMAPTLQASQALGVKQILYFTGIHDGAAIAKQFDKDTRRCDIRKEIIYEILKVSALRDLKRKRFLRALFAAGSSFTIIFLAQLYRSLVI